MVMGLPLSLAIEAGEGNKDERREDA